MASWTQIARRIRVPLGFAFIVFYLWLAQPSYPYVVAGGAIVLLGLALRAVASGYVRKASELTTTGPYAYTRNPLYLGSVIIALGFALAGRSLWIAVVLCVMFAAIYVPVIRFEEEFLRGRFAGFDDYARRVPRLIPRFSATDGSRGGFSLALYLQHREYNAVLGAAALMAALIVKLIWF